MIIAAGLSPAWQQIMVFEKFAPGEVNRAAEVHWCASGKVLNVGIALTYLGGQPLTLTILGGEAAKRIETEFARIPALLDAVPTSRPTRVCTTILDKAAGRTTELVENAGPISPQELQRFLNAYAAQGQKVDAAVLTGSLPPGAPVDFYRQLVRLTKGACVLDVRGPELLLALEERPLMVKPNREELAATLGTDLETDDELHRGMRELNRRGAQWVVVTQGKHAVWASSGGKIYCAQPPAVQVVNPIGCGDCLAAGFAWGMAKSGDPLASLRTGIAAASLNAETLLPGRLSPRRVEALAPTIELRQL